MLVQLRKSDLKRPGHFVGPPAAVFTFSGPADSLWRARLSGAFPRIHKSFPGSCGNSNKTQGREGAGCPLRPVTSQKTVTRRILRPNSKRVAVASECVSGNNSFCSGVVFLAYLSAYKRVFRFGRASLSGWRSPGTSILRSAPRAVRRKSESGIHETFPGSHGNANKTQGCEGTGCPL